MNSWCENFVNVTSNQEKEKEKFLPRPRTHSISKMYPSQVVLLCWKVVVTFSFASHIYVALRMKFCKKWVHSSEMWGKSSLHLLIALSWDVDCAQCTFKWTSFHPSFSSKETKNKIQRKVLNADFALTLLGVINTLENYEIITFT